LAVGGDPLNEGGLDLPPDRATSPAEGGRILGPPASFTATFDQRRNAADELVDQVKP
jgi:hypothetical protein